VYLYAAALQAAPLVHVTRYAMSHQGEQLQEAIKQSGVPISRLVQELGITRPTIYRKFREATLDTGFVNRVSDIIGRSVTNEALFVTHRQEPVPTQTVTNSVSSPPSTTEEFAKALITLQQKHIKLLEDYNVLLMKVYGNR
jgi:predicted transcriptional regulator